MQGLGQELQMVRSGMGITFVTKPSLLLISKTGLVMGQPVFGFGCTHMMGPSEWQRRDDQGEVDLCHRKCRTHL